MGNIVLIAIVTRSLHYPPALREAAESFPRSLLRSLLTKGLKIFYLFSLLSLSISSKPAEKQLIKGEAELYFSGIGGTAVGGHLSGGFFVLI